ncbi:hypothetical protein [Kistimonas asteriae]|uniref:hypothetical protein n=1 Tax=Kistimonas asteriae TaxID=517724 RepID=UPI001BA988C7|nr:hypothetical protein [Kistimonas asteriae]
MYATLQTVKHKEKGVRLDSGVRNKCMSNSQPIQMLTALAYAPAYQRPGGDNINAMRHARVSMTNAERNTAAVNSGYVNAGAAPGWCNHHVPYAMVRDGIEDMLTTSPDLATAVANANGVNVGGGIPQANIPNTGTIANPTYDEGTLNTEIDDMVANLANDPRNLFFWPANLGDAGGTQIDEPVGHGPLPVNNVRGNLRNYQQTLRTQNVI